MPCLWQHAGFPMPPQFAGSRCSRQGWLSLCTLLQFYEFYAGSDGRGRAEPSGGQDRLVQAKRHMHMHTPKCCCGRRHCSSFQQQGSEKPGKNYKAQFCCFAYSFVGAIMSLIKLGKEQRRSDPIYYGALWKTRLLQGAVRTVAPLLTSTSFWPRKWKPVKPRSAPASLQLHLGRRWGRQSRSILGS